MTTDIGIETIEKLRQRELIERRRRRRPTRGGLQPIPGEGITVNMPKVSRRPVGVQIPTQMPPGWSTHGTAGKKPGGEDEG